MLRVVHVAGLPDLFIIIIIIIIIIIALCCHYLPHALCHLFIGDMLALVLKS